MANNYQQQTGNEKLWSQVFAEGHPELVKQHFRYKWLPHAPRCKLCLVPFAGVGGWIMRRKGKGPSSRNPKFCSACDGFLEAFPGGAEVELSLLFVDIRHSTQFAETSTPAEVNTRVNLFLDIATKTLTGMDGFILAFYGDCVVGVWPPGFSGRDHAEKATQAALKIAQNKLMIDARNSPIPIGIGVHTGKVFIGTVAAAKGLFRDVSVFGSNVILTARLASNASAFEALTSADTLSAAGRSTKGLECRTLNLKGISTPFEAFVLR